MFHLRKSILVLSVLLFLNVAFAQDDERQVPPAGGGEITTITMVGTGMDKDTAIRDAQRKAIEKGAGTYIYSQSQTRDFTLVKDTILARSAGFIQKYDVLWAKEIEDGTWEVKIRADVSVKGIQDTWGVVTNLLKEMGRPKIMVFINERISEEQVETSTVQTRIEDLLLKSGFVLVDKNQLKEIDKKDLAAAIAEDKPDRMQAIAKRFGAQIFISGSADARRGNDTMIGGVDLATFEAVANVRTFRSDTGQLMSSIAGQAQRGVQRVARSAAQQALTREAEAVAGNVTNDILRFWMDVLEGRGEVQLHVEGLTFKQYTALKKALSKVKQITEANGDFHNQTAEMSLQSDLGAEKLAEIISEQVAGLEVEDVTQNVIKAKFNEK